MAKAKVYKTYRPLVQFKSAKAGEIVFRNGRLVTADPNVIEFIEKHILKDPGAGVFVDPNESETDELPPGTNTELKQKQLQEFLHAQTARIDAGHSVESGAVVSSTANNPMAGGKSAPAPRFVGVQNQQQDNTMNSSSVNQSIQEAMKAKLAESGEKKE